MSYVSTDPPLNGQVTDEFERSRQPSSRLDTEAVRYERMLFLKKSRAGHLGNLNRLYKDVELLMRNAENYHEACGKRENVDIAFARCLQAYDEFYRFVDDPELKSEAFDARHSVMTGKKEFDERFEEWSQSVQRIADEAAAGLRQEDNANEEVPNITPSLVGSSSKKSSKRSSKSSSKISSKASSRASDRSRKARAELLRREVELKNLLKRHEVERQMERQIAEKKTQEEELRRRIALLTAEGEIEKAKVVDDLYETSEQSKRNTNEDLKPLKHEENTEEMRQTFPSVKQPPTVPHDESSLRHGDNKQVQTSFTKSALNPNVQSWDPGPPPQNISGGSLTSSQSLQQILKQQQDALHLMAFSIQQGFEMPKRELLTFDGNPQNYWLFVNNFEVNIARRVSDAASRLAYLVQHCTGKAREAIKDCAIISDPEQGYMKAQEILYHRFGQKHIVAHAHIAKIVEGPQLKNTDITGLSDLSVQMQNCALTLVQMGYEADINSSDNLVKIVKRLPIHLQSKWADRAGTLTLAGTEPTFTHLAGFVEEKALLANTMYGRIVGSTPDKERSTKPPSKLKPPSSKGSTYATQSGMVAGGAQVGTTPALAICPLCSGQHRLSKCELMKAKTPEERKSFVRQARLCDNCFQSGHIAMNCTSKNRCQVSGCGWKHHTMLHVRKKNENSVTSRNNLPVTSQQTGSSTVSGTGATGTSTISGAGETGQCSATNSGKKNVCLRIVPVVVKGKGQHNAIMTNALLDPGSDVTLCDVSLMEKLQVDGHPKEFSLVTVNGVSETRMGYELSLSVRGLRMDEEIELNRVWTVETLRLPQGSSPTKEDAAQWSHLNGIDFPRIQNDKVSLLIGCDVPEAHWVCDQRRGRRGQPYAVLTPLGWTLMGPLNSSERDCFSVNFVRYDDEMLHRQMESMFRNDFNEPMITSKVAMSVEDRRALSQMEESAKFVNGHYQLAMPWKSKPVNFPKNRDFALGRSRKLRKRFQRDVNLFEKYKDTINGYVTSGYARRVPCDEQDVGKDTPVWYLPHHPVFHPQKPGKVRVVFDCAAKFKDTSLNDQLLQGPDLTNGLVGVLIRFRQEPVAMVADVEGMFHQVRVAPEDCHALRFLWWPNNDLSEEPVDYQMLVHLFGATSSPSCASFSLRKTAADNQAEFDAETVDTVNRNFYVDDCLKSVPSTDKAVRLSGQLRELLSRGGFRLTKWISNDRNVLATVPVSERAASVVDLDLEDLPVERTLGVQWDMETDDFKFRIMDEGKAPTRRGILSVVSSMYDPLGFVAPVILPAKSLLQSLCKQQYGWDEVISNADCIVWQGWIKELACLRTISVPRCFKPSEFGTVVNVQLHHFSDASEYGYGAVSYLRIVDDKGIISCSFVLGKSRVTPLKVVSIPRLELTAAVVAVKLNCLIRNEIEYPIHDTIYWTDSTVVLQYIRNESRRFQTFVANRVAMIHEESTPRQWRHVDTSSNPADVSSRGAKGCELHKMELWLHGPEFLWKEDKFWPEKPSQLPELPEDDSECRKRSGQVNVIVHGKELEPLLTRYSSWDGLRKAIAWLVRFKKYLVGRASKAVDSIAKGPLTVAEVVAAESDIVKAVQRNAFPEELAVAGQRGSGNQIKCFPRSSPIRNLNPFLAEGILRVGGRLENAPVPFEAMHPAILPSKDHVTNLIIQDFHRQQGHCGPTHVLTSIRQKYWIVRGLSAVRRVLANCMDCRKRNVRPGEQIMAPLPEARIAPSEPPFTHVGVDYFGPLYVKQGRSEVKRYGCLFTCLTMRAVHIEVAHTLEADSFICVYQRFVCRRGKPRRIYSDNGTNFTGAERELREALERLDQTKVYNHLRIDDVQWSFNPPEASHQGGIWERMIRSVRKILAALVKEQLMNDEALTTLLCEVEKILNDRPLTLLSDHPDDPEPLTPNKLLLLKSNPCLPLDVLTKHDKYGKRWRQAQCLANSFWKRWIKEYLPALQTRQRWVSPRRNFAVGDLVLVADEKTPRGSWPMGIIEEVFPDSKGFIRRVKVRTVASIYTRDIRKLCLLEGVN